MAHLIPTSDGKYKLYNNCSIRRNPNDEQPICAMPPNPEKYANSIDWNKSSAAVSDIVEGLSADFDRIKMYTPYEEKKENDIEIDNESIIDDRTFWQYISKIRCVDKDDGRMTKKSIKLTVSECRATLVRMNELIRFMVEHVKNTPLITLVPESECTNLFSHIISKGEEFYKAVISDYTFGLYLQDQYYPIHYWLESRYHRE